MIGGDISRRIAARMTRGEIDEALRALVKLAVRHIGDADKQALWRDQGALMLRVRAIKEAES